MEEKTETGHSLHDVVSLLRVFPSIWANLEPYSKKVNGRKYDGVRKTLSLIHISEPTRRS